MKLQPRHARRLALPLFVLALAGAFVLLRMPGEARQFTLDHWLRWPIELPIAVALLVLVPRRWVPLTGTGLAGLVFVMVLLRLGDLGSRFAFGRAFSPLADLHLFRQGWNLASQSVGRVQALAIVCVALLALSLAFVVLATGLACARHFKPGLRLRVGVGAVALLVTGLSLGAVQLLSERDFRVRADIASEFLQRIDALSRAVQDQRAFAAELAVDPIVGQPTFAALGDQDLIVLFVESYGRSFVDAPPFAERAATSLDALARHAAAAGLQVKSGWLDSPIRGGRSWLAHASFASGLSLGNQARFDRLMASSRRSLPYLLSGAGRHSVTVLPVVSTPWVEGTWYRVDQFVDGPGLRYRGKGFGYVTMPDQFTLSAFERLIRAPNDTPLAATIGLLGSHAPWGPLALPVGWDEVGDGSIFDGSHRTGRPINWANPIPVRNAYARSLELTLARIGEYLALHGEHAVVIVLGDHQPASVIAGWAPNAHVPVHVFASDERLLQRLPSEHFTDGTVPGSDAPALAMASLRELLSSAFETPLNSDGPSAAVRP